VVLVEALEQVATQVGPEATVAVVLVDMEEMVAVEEMVGLPTLPLAQELVDLALEWVQLMPMQELLAVAVVLVKAALVAMVAAEGMEEAEADLLVVLVVACMQLVVAEQISTV
jgi:hypothetical protein